MCELSSNQSDRRDDDPPDDDPPDDDPPDDDPPPAISALGLLLVFFRSWITTICRAVLVMCLMAEVVAKDLHEFWLNDLCNEWVRAESDCRTFREPRSKPSRIQERGCWRADWHDRASWYAELPTWHAVRPANRVPES